jgi:hypothetical protein
MAGKKKAQIQVHDLSKRRGALKAIGGSMDDGWNNLLANETVQTLWLKDLEPDVIRKRRFATVSALIGINAGDELEGMVAAQLIACHNAAMECYRRAMIRDQTFEGRQENLNQANKLSRTYTMLLEARNRGQQRVQVEHIHVHQGGQAIVGNIEAGGAAPKTKDQPHALGYAPSTAMPRTDTSGEPMPVARDEERPLPDARRPIAGRAEGK